MKMTKKLFMVAIATAAIALTSCGMGDKIVTQEGGSTKQTGTKKGLTVEVVAGTEGKKYARGWKQLGTSTKVQSLETDFIVDMSKVTNTISLKSGTLNADDATYVVDPEGTIQVRAVTGLLFDLHEIRAQEIDEGNGKKKTVKYYNFAIVGYRPDDNGIYVETYKDIAEDAFSEPTNATGFGATSEYITDSQSGFIYKPDDSVKTTAPSWVTETNTKFAADEDGKDWGDKAVPQRTIKIKISQPTPGTYTIEVGGETYTWKPEDTEGYEEKITKTWYNNDGYRLGGAAYYVNAPLGTTIHAKFDSKNPGTKGLEEEVDE